MKKYIFIPFFIVILTLTGCQVEKRVSAQRDYEAEKLLQGIWVDADDETPVFKAEGDTIYYPKQNVLPVAFRIVDDTLCLESGTTMKYAIERLTENVFHFLNNNGDMVKLAKSADASLKQMFEKQAETISVNQQLQKSDTVVFCNDVRYHCYVQVNPTSFKVVKQEYNDEGVGVGATYYDNIVNLNVYNGAKRLFSSNFRKQDFDGFIPVEILQQCILSDIIFDRSCKDGLVFVAQLCIPESAVTYLVEIVIFENGEKTLRLS